MNYTQKALDILEQFEPLKSWEASYRQLMQMGKQLPPLASQYKQDEYLVKGCESQVWLYSHKDQHQHYHFELDSNARIVRGLLMIVHALFEGLTAEQISAVDVEQYFSQLNLLKHLSPSRANGINAIIKQIQSLD